MKKALFGFLLTLALFTLAACGDEEEETPERIPTLRDDVELDESDRFEDAPDYIINGNFETGDLSGWSSVGLAFTTLGVTSDATYWSEEYPFNHEGDYHFYGHYAAPERMTGEMHSNVFQVSGEGELSFLMGAGRSPDLAYVALVCASTDEELEQIGNENFSDPENANNYHRYSFDLDDYVGEYLYVKVANYDDTMEGFGYVNVDDFRIHYD